jgi:hypothetical protein
MEIFAALVFASVGLIALAGVSLVSIKQRPVKKRLARLADGSRAQIEAATDDSGLLHKQAEGMAARILGALAGRSAREDDGSDASLGRVRARLIQAGFRRRSALSVFMGSRILLAVMAPVIVAALSPAWDLTRFQLVVLGASTRASRVWRTSSGTRARC